ncbi:VWD domain-containing protein [Deinococcus fonticola]|uniref:VWD domain-containing protein n=1 Tax=Deinococcus fonticola TaxID=2528713 RepID=UPI0010752633|nr:VWD domain-containing protein [Deinococcus fonticola]
MRKSFRPNLKAASGIAALSAVLLTGCGSVFNSPTPVPTSGAVKQAAPFKLQAAGLQDASGFTRITTTLSGGSGLTNAVIRLILPAGAKIAGASNTNGLNVVEDNLVFVAGQGTLTTSIDITGLSSTHQVQIELVEAQTATLVNDKTTTTLANLEKSASTLMPQSASFQEGFNSLQTQLRAQTLKSTSVAKTVKADWLKYEAGDLTQDQKVTLDDTLLLTNYLLNNATLTEGQIFNADLIDNGTLNNDDLSALIAKRLAILSLLSIPALDVHPQLLTINNEAKLLAIQNAGTGSLNPQVTTNASWITLTPVQSGIHPSSRAFELTTAPNTPVGITGTVTIKSGFDVRKVTVTSAASTLPGVVVPVVYTVKTAEATGLTTVLTPYGRAVNGTQVNTNIPTDNALIVVGQNAAGDMVALDALTQGIHETIQFNAERSAVGLVLTAPEMLGVSGAARKTYASQVTSHPRYADLVQIIRSTGRITLSQAELDVASVIATDLVQKSFDQQGVTTEQVNNLIQQLAQLQKQSVVSVGTVGGKMQAQAVECGMFEGKLLELKQDGDSITLYKRMPLAANIYVLPGEIRNPTYQDLLNKNVGKSYLSAPTSVTGVGLADWAISSGALTPGGTPRNANFSIKDLDAATLEKFKGEYTSGAYSVYAVYTKFDSTASGMDSPIPINNAGVVNSLVVLNNFLNIVGFGFEGSKLEKAANSTAAIALVTAFTAAVNTGELGIAIQSFKAAQEQGNEAEMAEQASIIVTNLAVFVKDRHEQLTNLGKAIAGEALESSYSASLEAVLKRAGKNVSKAILNKVAAGLNAAYAVGTLSYYGSRLILENQEEPAFSQGFVTTVGSEREGKGCFVPKPPPPLPPLPEIPPIDQPDPDDGRAPEDGSNDGDQGPTLPLPEEPGTASSFGDPHLSTFEQQVYSFQAAGEFILTQSLDDSFEVQARYVPLGDTQMSANNAIAMRVGGDRVGIYATKTNAPRLMINGQEILLTEGQAKFIPLPFGGSVSYDGKLTMVHWKDGSFLSADIRADILGRVSVTVPAARRSRLTGLLGNFDGNTQNDYQTRDGQVLQVPVPTPSIYSVFGESWRIKPEESLFDYLPGQSTYTFTNRAFPSAYAGLVSLTSEQRLKAEQICKDAGILSKAILAKCTVDVGITNNPDWAYFSAGVDPNIPAITVAPVNAFMLTNTTREFSGLVSGPQRLGDRSIQWSTTGGTVTPMPGGGLQYTAPSIPGTYQISAVSTADPSLRKTVSVTVTEPSGTISGVTRFVLKWGNTPNDLDTHLWLPESQPYHVYWGRKGNDDSCPNASLDVDDTDAFGPEVMKVARLNNVTGAYQLYIHNYSSTGTFQDAQATVEVVDEKGLVNVISPSEGEGNWWHVLNLDAQTGQIQLVNTVGTESQPYPDTDLGCAPAPSGLRQLSVPSVKWTPDSRK